MPSLITYQFRYGEFYCAKFFLLNKEIIDNISLKDWSSILNELIDHDIWLQDAIQFLYKHLRIDSILLLKNNCKDKKVVKAVLNKYLEYPKYLLIDPVDVQKELDLEMKNRIDFLHNKHIEEGAEIACLNLIDLNRKATPFKDAITNL